MLTLLLFQYSLHNIKLVNYWKYKTKVTQHMFLFLSSFGCKVKGRKTGIVFNNDMNRFSDPQKTNASANYPAPNKVKTLLYCNNCDAHNNISVIEFTVLSC